MASEASGMECLNYGMLELEPMTMTMTMTIKCDSLAVMEKCTMLV